MATVPVPRTWVNGEFVTDAIMNGSTGIRDALDFLLDPPGAQVRRGTAQSIPNNTATAIVFDTEDLDNDGMHSLVTNPSRLTCVTPGRYLVSGNIPYDVNAATGTREVRVVKNGAASAVAGGRLMTAVSSATVGTTCALSALEVSLDVGDYLELVALQVSGGSLNTFAVNGLFPVLRARWVGP